MATMEQLFCTLKQTQARDTVTPNTILDMAHEWKGLSENLFKSLANYFPDIEVREKTLSLVRESLEKRFIELEEKEREFDCFQERKREELNSREEKLDGQLKVVQEHIERLEVSQSGLWRREHEKFKEIQKREREIDLFHGSLEKRLREVENREKEFDALHDGKLRELALKEENLSRKTKEFVEKVKLANEELWEKQKLGCGLIERLELAKNVLEKMNVAIDERFKEMESWEIATHESLSAKLNEADLIRESLEKQYKELKKTEDKFDLFRENKAQKLKSEECQCGTMRAELVKDFRMREKKLTDVAGESLDFGAKDVDLSGASANLQESIAYKCQQLDRRASEVKLEGNLHDILEQSELTEVLDSHFRIDTHESADLKHALQKDGKTLEMFINRTEQNLELMDDEIFKILLPSSDPARFVLDAVGRLYTTHLGKGSNESKMWKLCILLLDQLTKMLPIIQPCVREAAIRLSHEWKSKISADAENPLEVLGFLHLLAAYNLSSFFDKNELFSFVKSVAQNKQTPELCRILGLAEKIPGFIQHLISEKQHLLASTYIYECGLEDVFPQAAILRSYVKHAKLSAKAKCRREHRSSEALDKGFASEMADLRVALEHIIKYGLESDYSPDNITSRIKQLERNQASLRFRSSSSAAAADMQKQGESKWPWDANKRKHVETKGAAFVPKPQRFLKNWHFPAWKGQNQERHPATTPVGSHKHLDLVGDETTLPSSAHKRCRKNYSSFGHCQCNFYEQ